VAEFTQPAPAGSSITSSIGYMRFGIGAGVEAYPAHFSNYPNDTCSQAWTAAPINYSFDAWVTHTRHIVNYMGSLNANGKQLMIALNEIAGYPNSFYDYPNDGAEVAANNSIGFGTENLGIGHVADAGTAPAPCNPQGTAVSIGAKHSTVTWARSHLNFSLSKRSSYRCRTTTSVFPICSSSRLTTTRNCSKSIRRIGWKPIRPRKCSPGVAATAPRGNLRLMPPL
jgi:hypothetical protein